MSRIPVRPFLITKEAENRYRLTIRETRSNSQGYPLVTEILQEESFPTAAAARAHARDQFGAAAGQYATK